MASIDRAGEVGHRVIKKHFLRLSQAVLRDKIPEKFYSEDLIDDNILEVLISPSFTETQKARRVLKQLQSSVRLIPGAFSTIVRILDEEDGTRDLAAALRGTLCFVAS